MYSLARPRTTAARVSRRMVQPAAVVASTGMAARVKAPNRAQVTGTRAGKMRGDRKRAGRTTLTALARELRSNDSTALETGPSTAGSLPPCSPSGTGLRASARPISGRPDHLDGLGQGVAVQRFHGARDRTIHGGFLTAVLAFRHGLARFGTPAIVVEDGAPDRKSTRLNS